VYRIAKKNGFREGIKAFKFRFKSCRPGYSIIEIEGENYLISVDKKVFNKTEFSSSIISN
jgi:hypothetical protein